MTRALPLAYSSPGADRPVPAWLVRVTYLSAVVVLAAFVSGQAASHGVCHRSYCTERLAGDLPHRDQLATEVHEVDGHFDGRLQAVARVFPLAAVVPAFMLMLRFKRRGVPFPLSFRLVSLLAFGLALINGLLPWTRSFSACTRRLAFDL